MNTSDLRNFAQTARTELLEYVAAKLTTVLGEHSVERRETPQKVQKLEERIEAYGRESVIDHVAYVWFNRFCALRFMDVNRYNRLGVVSPAPEQTQPEILADAKRGHIDERLIAKESIRQNVSDLLNGRTTSPDPQGEAYRQLLLGVCDTLNKAMPYLFRAIDDYSELLMPDDLLSERSILAKTRDALTENACKDVEVIGWLYQYYISEKKDAVIGKVVKTEDIPAATQLFTPNWIVQYLVQNSLGRLWLLNRPDSRLAEQMEYYIPPEAPDTGFLRVRSVEELKICDPACGSGHILVYTFDLLYAIYEEEGYSPSEIPEKILTHNLYGIEIDERAGELAAFTLSMKARAKHRRFFEREEPVVPNICVLQNISINPKDIDAYMDEFGDDLFAESFRNTLTQFENAKAFGSLIQPELSDVTYVRGIIKEKNIAGNIFLGDTHQKVELVLNQAEYLQQKYHVVVANPPYMGGKGLNADVKAFVAKNYPKGKSDLATAFMERNFVLTLMKGIVAMITMQSWMFLSSFDTLRAYILEEKTILSMAHLGARAFDSIGGEVVSTTAFVVENCHRENYRGAYFRLVDGSSEAEKMEMLKEGLRQAAGVVAE